MAKQAVFEPIIPARPRALSDTARKCIENRIEQLISVLDVHDAPTDDEPDNDGEGSIGWPEDVNQDRALKASSNDDVGVIFGPDREADGCDAEPSLGSSGCTYDADYFNQDGWAAGGRDDAEGDEHDGREPDVDDEYEMGWPEMIDQERARRPMKGAISMGGDQWWPAYCEGEPSLGSVEQIDQRGWSRGGTRDLEEQCEDEGHDSDSEADIEADLEPPSAPFELVQREPVP